MFRDSDCNLKCFFCYYVTNQSNKILIFFLKMLNNTCNFFVILIGVSTTSYKCERVTSVTALLQTETVFFSIDKLGKKLNWIVRGLFTPLLKFHLQFQRRNSKFNGPQLTVLRNLTGRFNPLYFEQWDRNFIFARVIYERKFNL